MGAGAFWCQADKLFGEADCQFSVAPTPKFDAAYWLTYLHAEGLQERGLQGFAGTWLEKAGFVGQKLHFTLIFFPGDRPGGNPGANGWFL